MNMLIVKVTEVVKSDDMIQRYGTTQLRKKGPKAVYEISQRMRHLARLKLRIDDGAIPINDVIRPDKFDAVIHGVEAESGLFVDKVGYVYINASLT